MRIANFHIFILLAIFHGHLLVTKTTTTLFLEASPTEACSGAPEDVSSSSQGICHESIGNNKNDEGMMAEEQHLLQGNLASQFGLGQTGAGAGVLMTTSGGSLVASSPTKPLPEFAIDYGHEVVAHNKHEREISMTFDHRGGARWRTHEKFESGTFSVKMKTPDGDTSGLNTSFYLSSQEGDKSQDEIDFEFLGKDKGTVQTNYYTVGKGDREEIHQLGFDSSLEFHEYTIRWSPSKIEWLIDGKLVRSAEKKGDDELFPVKPMYLYASLWNAGDINGGMWAGSYSGSHAPYVCKYRDVEVPMNHSKSTNS